jgi:hypothetical protein
VTTTDILFFGEILDWAENFLLSTAVATMLAIFPFLQRMDQLIDREKQLQIQKSRYKFHHVEFVMEDMPELKTGELYNLIIFNVPEKRTMAVMIERDEDGKRMTDVKVSKKNAPFNMQVESKDVGKKDEIAS